MIDREELLQQLNSSGLAGHMTQLKQALLLGATNTLIGKDNPKFDITKNTSMMLDMVGPAAASAAVDYAIQTCKGRGQFRDVQFNGHYIHNYRLVQNRATEASKNPNLVTNEPMEEMNGFSSVLRQFLLPRYAYLDFDMIVDPRHRIDYECGYPKFITPIMYRYLYDRDDIARRVVDFYPNEAFVAEPEVYETEDETKTTKMEGAWTDLCDSMNMMQMIYRIAKLARIGHYGSLLLGVDDGKDLEEPIDEPRLLAGARRSVSSKERHLLYMRPFDEYLSFIHMYETDPMHPRYGLPKFYNLVFLDMTIDAAGASIGTRLNRRVHWTRVVHVADNLQGSLVFGTPAMQPVFNRLLDLRKVKGSSAEMFWKGGFPGINFEIDPRFVADDPEFDKEEFRKEIRQYQDGLSRMLTTVGIKANSLAPTVADPEKHVRIQMEAIACALDTPSRVWTGSEEGRVASAQDTLRWNQRVQRYCRLQLEPSLLRNTIDRFIAIGVMPPPETGKYFVGWSDLNAPTNEDRANLALKWTQALSQYVSSGVIHLIPPLEYMTLILGIRPEDAIRIDAYVQKNGGYQKLYGVNPDQGAGENGIRKRTASPGKSAEDPKPRNTADKKAEGMAS